MSPSRKPLSTLQCLKTNFKKKNLFVWLCQFSVMAHGIFIASCGIFHLTCRLLSLWRADSAVAACRLRFPQHVESQFPESEISEVLVAQSCPAPFNPINCSPPGSSVRGILQARMLEWVAMPFSRGPSRLRDRTQVSCIAGIFFTVEPPGNQPVFPVLEVRFLTTGPPGKSQKQTFKL